jgi:hypothetical protein
MRDVLVLDVERAPHMVVADVAGAKPVDRDRKAAEAYAVGVVDHAACACAKCRKITKPRRFRAKRRLSIDELHLAEIRRRNKQDYGPVGHTVLRRGSKRRAA